MSRDAITAIRPALEAIVAERAGDPSRNGAALEQRPTRYAVTFTGDRVPKLILPVVPAHDDHAGLLAWQTSVMGLDPRHPATRAVHEGQAGPDGHVHISRAGAPPIRFEPASIVNTARKFLPALGWQLQPTDREPFGFKDEHCRRIAHVLRLACGTSKAPDAKQEAAAIAGTFLGRSEAVEGYTGYGTSPQRYEAAEALRRDDYGSPARYLIDSQTGELCIRVSDLQAAAREHVGASLPHGWLQARMEHLGWDRVRLDGHRSPGREGRGGPHARCDVFRGHLPTDDDGPVTT